MMSAEERWQRSADAVLGAEGGYSNRPLADDPGGETNMGITKTTLEKAYAAGLVLHDDPRVLTRLEALKIYRSWYWEPIGCPDTDWAGCLLMFDLNVNSGRGGLATVSQRACRDFGTPVVVDGLWGPVTRWQVVKNFNGNRAREFAEAFLACRWAFMRSLKNFVANKNGWYARILKLAGIAGVAAPVRA
jgi:lysozyme family protein